MKAAQYAQRDEDGAAYHEGRDNALAPASASLPLPVVHHDVDERSSKDERDEGAGGRQKDEEEAEVPVVREANTVVDPWTVVVHSQDAAPTDPAMMSARRLQPCTSWALPWRELADLLNVRILCDLSLVVFWRCSRVHED